MLKILQCSKLVKYAQRSYAKNHKVIDNIDMKYLNVAEKHDAAKTIAGLLSNGTARRREGYSVYNKVFDFEATVKGRKSKMVMTSVSGHLLQLEFLVSYRNWRNVDPKALFDAPIRKACNEDFLPIKRTLEREIRGCQGLIIWTDCDREGENIGFEIVDVCKAIKPDILVYRAKFSEITGVAVRRALQKLTAPDKRQSDAVDIRTELDLRTGAAITRFQTMRLQRLFPEKIADKLISYGSCQIPTLGFVAERYKEVEAFVSEPFWKLKVTHTIDDLTVDFNWARNRLFDQQACEDYLLLCLADPKATVESVTVKPKSKWRPTPMDTVEMEKLGSRKLKLSAKETMTIAEKLYTKGIISYPRTETNQFSKEFDLTSLVQQQTSHAIWGTFAQRVIEWGANPRNGNKSDQAHPPIHPTKLVTNLEGNEGRVYELICRHFLACVSKDAVGSETVVHINIAGEKFTATGLCIYERNYLDVYIYDKWNAKEIHKYEQGQVFEPTEISMQEGATTAPPLLTEADLIALMEKHGIGTDATHAEHINTIKERGYIGVVDKGCLVPGVIGMGLYEGYDAMELELAKPVLRAAFEADLKKICLGEKDPKAVLSEQIEKYKIAYQQIMEKITAMDEKIAHRVNETPTSTSDNGDNANATNNTITANNFENNPNRLQELFQCPKCNVAPLALKQKRNQSGHFIGCLNFPDCKNVIWLPDDCKEPSVLEETCTKCGSRVKLLKVKFANKFYKTIFNTPNGWYKTCLHCDANFREAFQINLDNVKSTGAIVSDVRSASSASTMFECNRNVGANSNAAPNRTNRNPGTSKTSTTRSTKKVSSTNAATTTTTTTNSNIRSYFTTSAAASSRQTNGNTSTTAAIAELDNAVLEEFFDSNDGFEEAILAAEVDIATSNNAPAVARNTSTTTSNSRNHVDDYADIAAAFNDDDDDDDNGDDFQWGTATSNTHRSQTSQRHAHGSTAIASAPATVAIDNNEESFSAVFREDDDFDDYIWGTAEHNRRKSQLPSAKRPCLREESNTNADDYDVAEFSAWNMSPSPRTPRSSGSSQTENVKCSGCHQPAKQLTVKKEGPNKGRQFFACPKSNACKFFQWADEVPTINAANSHSQTYSSTSTSTRAGGNSGWGTSTTSNTDDANNAENVKCNCGQVANSLIVRKDGPNKGRPFYACSNRDKSCGFFKWSDENDADRASTSTAARNRNSATIATTSWGTNASSNRSTNNNRRDPGTTAARTRKCGLCRQEGHTKLKCPRKAEFEF